MLGIATLLCGCQGGSTANAPRTDQASTAATAAPEDGSLLPVPVPDLARREPDARERLLELRADLDRALAGNVAPAELGRLFAQAGMQYHTHGLGPTATRSN